MKRFNKFELGEFVVFGLVSAAIAGLLVFFLFGDTDQGSAVDANNVLGILESRPTSTIVIDFKQTKQIVPDPGGNGMIYIYQIQVDGKPARGVCIDMPSKNPACQIIDL